MTDRCVNCLTVMTSPVKAQDFQVLGGNSIGMLRYPSGAPETFPHKGETNEETFNVGMNAHTKSRRLNFRFKDTRRDRKGCDGNSPTISRPQVRFVCIVLS